MHVHMHKRVQNAALRVKKIIFLVLYLTDALLWALTSKSLLSLELVSSEVRGAPPSPLTYATRRPPSDAYHGSPLLCLREHLRLVLSTVINQKM